ncbi:Sb-PDE family phosphodiesterase [Opitutales bacterium]|jgi:3',5'-nucleoside bisphosphate phosphatase|nr:Sb-PDE family phosphodiesterase [Opitutales bacterium]
MTSFKSSKQRLVSSVLLILTPMLILSQKGWGHGSVSNPTENESRKIVFPDTADYQTLVLDPHTHSAFSDGHVWPRIRVEEALRDGLDAMAITEHLEYQPHIADIPHPDRNRAYEDAISAAKNSDLLVIPGAEITRGFPASHMNALFVSDANKLMSFGGEEPPRTSDEHSKITKAWPAQNAVQAANDQGAFVFWNHSWWTSDFPTGIPIISEFHQNNAQNGLLHGIEIANGKYFSEDAFQIALDYNLTLMGVSDVHDLIDWDYEPHKGGHRPVTLVLAKDRSIDAIKEALFDKRTVVWYKNWLIGRKGHLDPLISSCLHIDKATYGKGEILNITVSNHSDADFHLRNLSPYGFHDYADNFVIPQHSSQEIMVRTPTKLEKITFQFEVLNAFVAPRQTTNVILEAIVD